MTKRHLRLIAYSAALALTAPVAAQGTPLASGDFPIGGTYTGRLSCADCTAIETKLTLDDRGVNAGAGNGSFVMTERFIGGLLDGETSTLLGKWSTVHWVKNAEYTGRLKLQPTAHGALPAPRYFYCDHGRSLRPVDVNGIPLSNDPKVTLLRSGK